MTSTLLPNAKQTFTGPNGTPLSGGSVYFYVPGTSTPKDTYQDGDQTILNTNPVVLDANGQAVIWGYGTYRQVVYDVNGNLIWDQITEDMSGGLFGNIVDNIFVAANGDFIPGTTTSLTLSSAPGSTANSWVFFDTGFQTPDQYAISDTTVTFNNPIPVGISEVVIKIGNTIAMGTPGSGTVTDASVATNAGIKATKLSYTAPWAGGVTETISAKLGESVSVLDFGAQRVACTSTPTVDATTAFQTAANDAASSGIFTVRVPAGAYLLAGQITVPQGVRFVGESDHSTIIPGSGQVEFGTGSILFITSLSSSLFVYTSGNYFRGLTFYYPNQLRTLATPISYPATFSPSSSPSVLTNVTWKEVGFVNAYFFIDARIGHLDFKFHDIEGAPLFWGIVTDGCGGTDDFQNVSMSYYYFCQISDAAATYMQNNAIGLQVGRSDQIQGKTLFFGSLHVGVRTFLGTVNSATGPYGTIEGLALDGNHYGLYCESTYGNLGLCITGMNSNSTIADIEMPVVGSQSQFLQIDNFKFWGACPNCIALQSSNSVLRLSNGEMYDYSTTGVSVSGVSGVSFTSENADYKNASAPPVSIQSSLSLMKLIGNYFSARPSLFTTAPTLCQIEGNAGYNGVVDTVTASSSLDLTSISDFVEISGSTTILTIAGGWTGRRVFFTSLNGALIFGIGGNILCGVSGITLAQNQGIELGYDGTNWRPTR